MPKLRPAPPPCLIQDETITIPRSPLSPITFFFFTRKEAWVGRNATWVPAKAHCISQGLSGREESIQPGCSRDEHHTAAQSPLLCLLLSCGLRACPWGLEVPGERELRPLLPDDPSRISMAATLRWPLWVWFGKRRGESPIGRGLPPWMRHGGAHPTLLLPPP